MKSWQSTGRFGGFVALLVCSGIQPALADEQETELRADTVVVTAQKRAQDPLDVSASLDVLTGAALADEQVFGIEELTQNIAGVNVAEFADGQYRLVYRGIGATGTSDNQNFSTSLDGVIVPYNRAFRLLDLERVEVLKGPQGTLYGRNTNAGVINIITQDGSHSGDSEIVAYGGSGETYGGRAAFGGTASEGGVFFRLAGRYEQSQGFVDNSVLSIDDSHATEDYTLRGTLGVDLGDWRVTSRLTYDSYDNNADNLTSIDTPWSSTAPDLGTSTGHMILPSLTIEGKLSGLDFTSISAYASTERDLNQSAVISPVLIGQLDMFESASQEFRLADDVAVFNMPASWVAGVYFLRERNKFVSTTVYTPFDLTLVDQAQTKTTSAVALFGELQVELSPTVSLTGGLRLAREDQDTDYRLAANTARTSISDSFTGLQPKAVLSWHPQVNYQTYVSATRGFRAGSVFISNPIDPRYAQEDVWQYEAGFKGDFLDGQLSFEGAIFYLDWTDMQVQRSVVVSAEPFQIGTVVDNASSARSFGTEFEAHWTPVPSLEFFTTAAWTDAKYDTFQTVAANGAGIDFSGNRIEYVPEYEAAIGGTFHHPAGLELSGSISRTGKMAFDSGNTAFQHPYTTLNASVAYDFERFRVSLVGRNLTDEGYFTRALVVTQGVFGYAGDPRTVMAEVSARF